MSSRAFTVEAILAGVEAMIEAMRWARSQPGTPEHATLELLKAIARNLRAQLDGASSRTMISLEYRINAALRQKARLGYYEIGALQGIGEEVIGKWPVLRRALDGMEER
jgi:non-ribosomal peptide synthetase component F